MGQVWQHLPDMTVYVHIRDENGGMVRELENAATTVFIGTEAVPVRHMNPFDPVEEGVAYILLVDVSKSLSIAQFGVIKEALSAWVESMTAKDFAAIMTIGSTIRLLQDFTVEKEKLQSTINTLEPTDMNTQLHLGLVRAMELGRRRDAELPGRRVIITLSDGQNDFAGGTTQTEVLNRVKEDPVPIYAIGFVKPPMTGKKESFLKILGNFARTSGGIFFKADDTPLPAIYDRMRQSVLDVWSAELDCTACRADGGLYRLQMTLSEGSRTLSDGLDIRLLPVVSEPEKPPWESPANESPEEQTVEPPKGVWWKKIPVWGYYAAGGLLILTLIIALLKKKKPSQGTEESRKGESIGTTSLVQSPRSPQAKAKGFPDTPMPGKFVQLTTVGTNKTLVFTHEVADEFIIGRNGACHLALKDDTDISGRHCRLLLKDCYLYVQDLGSTNGTLINGVPVSGMYRLHSGDLLLIGRTELRISFT
nr:FHA domain-containing protein [uncultured Desulfobacter sp.]